MTVHYDFDHDGNVEQDGNSYTHGDMSLDYHVYTLIYLPGYIKWMVDGQQIFEYYRYFEFSDIPLSPVECTIYKNKIYFQNLLFPFPPMNVIFNMAVQNGDDDKPNNHTSLPAQMEIDWFRYYINADNEIVQPGNINQQYLNSEIHNGYAAYNVILDTLTIPSDAKISISALNKVELRPGFEAEHGSDVNFFIHQEPQQHMAYANANTKTEKVRINIQQNDSPEISVYPNPTSENVTVSCPKETVGNGVILVYSSDGILMYKTDITGQCTTVAIDYPSGIYILAIHDKDNRVSSFKIVKK